MLVSPLEFKVNGIYFKYTEFNMVFEDTNKELVEVEASSREELIEKLGAYFSFNTLVKISKIIPSSSTVE